MDIEKLRAMRGVAKQHRERGYRGIFFIDNCGEYTGWWDRRREYVPDAANSIAFAACDCIVVFSDDSVLLLSRDEEVAEFRMLWELER